MLIQECYNIGVGGIAASPQRLKLALSAAKHLSLLIISHVRLQP